LTLRPALLKVRAQGRQKTRPQSPEGSVHVDLRQLQIDMLAADFGPPRDVRFVVMAGEQVLHPQLQAGLQPIQLFRAARDQSKDLRMTPTLVVKVVDDGGNLRRDGPGRLPDPFAVVVRPADVTLQFLKASERGGGGHAINFPAQRDWRS
jgi:hypothetical protein